MLQMADKKNMNPNSCYSKVNFGICAYPNTDILKKSISENQTRVQRCFKKNQGASGAIKDGNSASNKRINSSAVIITPLTLVSFAKLYPKIAAFIL